MAVISLLRARSFMTHEAAIDYHVFGLCTDTSGQLCALQQNEYHKLANFAIHNQLEELEVNSLTPRRAKQLVESPPSPAERRLNKFNPWKQLSGFVTIGYPKERRKETKFQPGIIVWMFAHLLAIGGAYKNVALATQLSCKANCTGIVICCSLSTSAFVAVSRYASATPLPHSVLSCVVGWQEVGILFFGIFGTGNVSSLSADCEYLSAEGVDLSMVKTLTKYIHGGSANLTVRHGCPGLSSSLDQVCRDVGKMNERIMIKSCRQIQMSANTSLPQGFPGFSERQQHSSLDDESSCSF